MRTNEELFREAEKRSAEKDKLFDFFVKDGLTSSELEQNIKRRPEVWGKYSHWLDMLPKTRRNI